MLKAHIINGGPFMGSTKRFWDAYYNSDIFFYDRSGFGKVQHYANPYNALIGLILKKNPKYTPFMGFI